MLMKNLVIISNQAFALVNFRGSLIKSLAAAGVCVFALAPDFNNELRQKIVTLGAVPVNYSLSRTGINPFRDVSDMFKLAALLRRLRPDVMLASYIKPVIFGTLAAWMAKVPLRVSMIEGLGFVYTSADATLSWVRRLMRIMVSILYRVALARAHRVIFLNRDDIAEFVSSRLVDESKVIYLDGIGVDLDEWPMTDPFTKPITFLMVARLLREKGILEYVEAARQVKVLYPDARFLLLGAQDSNPSAISHQEIQGWVKEDLLEWPGHVAVKTWLAQTSVFVLPSYREGLPRSTQEAMAMGRAVITTSVPGCRETVVDGKNGYMVPVRNATALAGAMKRFIENPHLVTSMGLESRRLAELRFDVHKINARMLDILKIGLDE